jgi:ureidoglycolate lyase
MKTIEIKIEPLSADAFAPFGEIIGKKSSAPTLTGENMEAWPFQFSIDGMTALTLNRFYYQSLEFSKLERHLHVTQAFLPLGKMPMVMIVSAPTKFDDWSSIPKPEDLHAFYVEGTNGIMLWKGSWHAQHRFPVRPPYVDIGLITELETQKELELELAQGSKTRRTQAIDFKKLLKVTFKVVDPLHLIN